MMSHLRAKRRTRRRAAPALASAAILITFARVTVGFCPRVGNSFTAGSTACRASTSECGMIQVGALQKRTATSPGTTTIMGISLAPSRTKAEKKSEHFKLSESGMVEFGSSQRLEVNEEAGSSEKEMFQILLPALWRSSILHSSLLITAYTRVRCTRYCTVSEQNVRD